MNSITWKYVKPLQNKKAVTDYLAAVGVELPSSLVSMLTLYNGGRPSLKDFRTVDGQEYVFKSLLSYNENDPETVYHVYPEIFQGTQLYPIGSDPAGNFICYDMNKKYYCLWNHETNTSIAIKDLPFDI